MAGKRGRRSVASGGDAWPHALAIAPLSAPRTQRCGRWVWCVPMGLGRRPNVMAGMQTGVAPLPRATAVGTEGPHADWEASSSRSGGRLRCEGETREPTRQCTSIRRGSRSVALNLHSGGGEKTRIIVIAFSLFLPTFWILP